MLAVNNYAKETIHFEQVQNQIERDNFTVACRCKANPNRRIAKWVSLFVRNEYTGDMLCHHFICRQNNIDKWLEMYSYCKFGSYFGCSQWLGLVVSARLNALLLKIVIAISVVECVKMP